MKFKLYFFPTPKRISIHGDSIAVASIFIASLNLDNPKLMLWCAILGGVGKLISNFIGIDDGINKT